MSTPKSPLDAIMTAQGRRNDWLAAAIGADEAQVSRWRSGKHVPIEATRELIAATLDTSADDIWGVGEQAAA